MFVVEVLSFLFSAYKLRFDMLRSAWTYVDFALVFGFMITYIIISAVRLSKETAVVNAVKVHTKA